MSGLNFRLWVDSFLVKKDKVKLVLTADKDDIEQLGQILRSLEMHSSSDHPVDLTTMRPTETAEDIESE